jgi:putative endonuclease
MVEQQPSKLMTRVRFPSPAPSASAKASAGISREVAAANTDLEADVPPKLQRRRTGCMTFVYLLQNELDPSKYYVGKSDDPARRLTEHNSGKSIHTNKYRPWKLMVSVGFADPAKATAFERYLKSGSGRAFAKKHF